MSTIIVHGIPGSPYVRIPLLACEEKGVTYRLAAMQLGESKSAEHLARHPFGRIPAIEHGEFKLYEAAAIIRYIDQAFDGPSLTPTDVWAQARMNQVMNIVDWYVMPSISAGLTFNRVIRPQFGMEVEEHEVTAALPLASEGREMLSGTPLPEWLERMNERPSAKNTSWNRLLEVQAAA
jgi:glutathione S-transferase